MRSKRNIILIARNKAIKKRFRELKKEGRNNIQCFDKMVWEFYLSTYTIRDIVWGRYDREGRRK